MTEDIVIAGDIAYFNWNFEASQCKVNALNCVHDVYFLTYYLTYLKIKNCH